MLFDKMRRRQKMPRQKGHMLRMSEERTLPRSRCMQKDTTQKHKESIRRLFFQFTGNRGDKFRRAGI